MAKRSFAVKEVPVMGTVTFKDDTPQAVVDKNIEIITKIYGKVMRYVHIPGEGHLMEVRFKSQQYHDQFHLMSVVATV